VPLSSGSFNLAPQPPTIGTVTDRDRANVPVPVGDVVAAPGGPGSICGSGVLPGTLTMAGVQASRWRNGRPTQRVPASSVSTRTAKSARWSTRLSRPVGLLNSEPFEVNIWDRSLPYRVEKYGKTIFRVVEFLPPGYLGGVLSGFVIADQAPGITVSGEVSYSEYAPVPAKKEEPAKKDEPADTEPPGASKAEEAR
jgi:hypothetical protein